MTRVLICMFSLFFTAASTIAEEKSADPLEPKFDDIVVAQSLINREVVDSEGNRIGIVDDIVLDLAAGRVAFFSTSQDLSVNAADKIPHRSRDFLLIPSLITKWEGDKPLRIAVTKKDLWPCSQELQSCSAAFVSESDLDSLYKFYHAAPSSTAATSDTSPPMLTPLDDLDGRVVRDAARVRFGRIEEILLSPAENLKIAYLALSQFNGRKDDRERLAVPLAAFVRLRATSSFLLDVPDGTRLTEPSFMAGDWPHKIERGWVEFTHVKYGAAATDGLQFEERADEN